MITRNIYYILNAFIFLLITNCPLNAQYVYDKWNSDYMKIYHFESDTFGVFREDNNLFGLMNSKGDTLLKPVYKYLLPDSTGLVVFSNFFSRYGVMDSNKKIITDEIYNKIIFIPEGFIGKKRNKQIIFNKKGEIIFHPIFSEYKISEYENGLYLVNKNGVGSGVIDHWGKWIISPQSAEIDLKYPGYIVINNRNNYTLFDRNGNKLNSKPFSNIYIVKDHIFVKHGDDNLFHPDSTLCPGLNYIIPFESIQSKNSYYITQTKGVSRLYSTESGLIVESREILFKNNGFSKHRNDVFIEIGIGGKKNLYKNNKKLTRSTFERFEFTSEFIVCINEDSVEFIDYEGRLQKIMKTNTTIIDKAQRISFSNSQMIDSIYFLDIDYSIKIEPYKYVSDLNKNTFTTRDLYYYTIYSLNGQLLVKNIEEIMYGSFFKNYKIYKKNSLWGWVCDNIVKEAEYEEVFPLSNELFLVSKDLLYFVVDKNGNAIDKSRFTEINNIQTGFILKENEKYRFLNPESVNFSNSDQFTDYKIINNNYLSFKVSNEWYIYNINKGQNMNITFSDISIIDDIIKTEKGVYYLDKFSDSLLQLNFDSAYIDRNNIIGKNSDHYTVYLDYTNNGLENEKKFICDSILTNNREIIFYKNNKINFYDLVIDSTYILDADSIKVSFDKEIKLVFQQDTTLIVKDSRVIRKIYSRNVSIPIDKGVLFIESDIGMQVYDYLIDSLIIKKYDRYIRSSFDYFIVVKDAKYGLLNRFHEQVLPCIYKDIKFITRQIFRVINEDNYMGVIDHSGAVLIPFDRWKIEPQIERNLIFAKNGTHIGFYNVLENKWYPPSGYSDLKDCNVWLENYGNLYMFKGQKGYGIMTEFCEIIVEPKYSNIINQGNILLLINNRKIYAFIPEDNFVSDDFERISVYDSFWIGEKRDSFFIYKNDVLLYKNSGFPGFSDMENSGILLFSKRSGSNLHSGVYSFSKNKFLIDPVYAEIKYLKNGNFILKDSSDRFYIYDIKTGNTKKIKIDSFFVWDSHILFQKNKKYGIMDNDGIVKVKPIFKEIELQFLQDQLNISLSSNGKSYIYNRNFDLICKLNYEYVGSFVLGLAPVRRDNKWGYSDIKGSLKIPMDFEYAEDFSKEYKRARVIHQGKICWIDMYGKLVPKVQEIEYLYYKIKEHLIKSDKFNFKIDSLVRGGIEFTESLNIGRDKSTDLYGLYDLYMNEILEPKFQKLSFLYFENKLYIKFVMNDKTGLMDSKQKIIAAPIYDKLIATEIGFFKALKSGKVVYLNKNGEEVEVE